MKSLFVLENARRYLQRSARCAHADAQGEA